MRDLGRRASPQGFGDDSSSAPRPSLARWWGRCAVNRLADSAGAYRRIASGLVGVTPPLIGLAAVLAGQAGVPTGYAVAHAVVAIGCGWLGVELFRTGSALGRGGRPRPSAMALAVGIGFLVVSAPRPPVAGLVSSTALMSGLAALVAGFLVLMGAERHRDRFLAFAGRWVVVAGAGALGAVHLADGLAANTRSPGLALGSLGVATTLLVTAGCETRVLLRGAALQRLLAQR